MAEADKNNRRADEAERARHVGASEAAAFATTAGAMLLGVLASAEAAQHRSEHQPQPAPEPTVPPSPAQPADAAPAQPSATDHAPIQHDEHGSATQPTPADSAAMIHADTAPDPGIATEAATDGGAGPTHVLVSSIP